MADTLTPAEQRVADALAAHALPAKVIVLDQLATTAQMAAEALGIEVGRIVKSLLFKGATSGKPYLLLVSGANRVHEKRTGRLIAGHGVERPARQDPFDHAGIGHERARDLHQEHRQRLTVVGDGLDVGVVLRQVD